MRNRIPSLDRWPLASLTTAVVLLLLPLLFPPSARAIPAFARKYDVKCFSCHTVFPRLNKTGYIFKRLGYRMPPDLEEGQAPPKISTVDKGFRWRLDDAAAIMIASSADWERTRAEGETESVNSINLDEGALFFGGTVPESNFSYFAEEVLYEEGEGELERAKVDFVYGDVHSSFFVGIGKTHLQEGFRASDMHGLVEDDAPMGFMIPTANNFSMEQNPGLVEVGYTWASPYYAQVLGLTMKVTNGVDAEGEAIAFESEHERKDIWAEGDFLFGPDGGVSAMVYRGRKDQIQNEESPDEFLYDPLTKRYGVFANYLFLDKIDILGGYIRTNEDWKAMEADPMGEIRGNAYFAEADYYFATGLAAFARYDKVKDKMEGGAVTSPMTFERFLLGGVKTVTDRGNVKVSLTYGHNRMEDMSGTVEKVDEARSGLVLGW